MRIDNNSAAVDNDFIAKVAQTRKSSMKPAQILVEIFRALNVQGVIHPLVYDKEVMQENPIVQSFFVEQVINRLGFEDIFQGDEDKKAYYMFLVPELYYALRGEQLPEGTNVLTYWKRKCSLGEIHTVSMCLVTSCSLFLSDDGDSKALMNIVHEKFAANIDVYNRNDVIACYQNSGATGLSRNEKRAFLHKT